MTINHWKGKKAGEKHHELIQHQDFIIQCLDVFGIPETVRLFGITNLDTLVNLIKSSEKPRKFSKVDKAELQSRVALAGYDAVNAQLQDLIANQDRKKKYIIEPFDGYLIREIDDNE